MTRTARYLAGLLAVASLIAAGCSSNSASTSPASSVGGATAPGPNSSSATAPSSGASSTTLTTVRVASDTNAGVLPMWVAMDQGIFKQHGLNVQYTQIDNVGTLPPQLNKTFDIAFVTPTAAIAATSKGIPVTEIAGGYTATTENPASWLMVKKGSNITSLAQLKGKTIGALTIAGTLNYATLNMLNTAGVPANSVKVIAVAPPQQLSQLNAGRVDAVETVEPFHQQMVAAGATSVGEPYQSMKFPLSAIWWGANPTWASQNATVVKEFVASLADAVTFINKNDEAARSILEKYTKLPEAVIKKYPFPDYDPSVRPEDIPKWLEVAKSYGGFNGTVDLSKLTFQP